MRVLPRNGKPQRWPFWFLLAAWFCANSPQMATYSLCLWIKGGQHFSHQQQLKADVALVLAGKAKMAAMLATAKSAPSVPRLPTIPVEAVLKKIDLYVAVTVEPALRAAAALAYVPSAELMVAFVGAKPPVPPPRAEMSV